jgi:hypothetical protein
MGEYHDYFDIILRPRDGRPGEPGPMPYPAGIYDNNKEYVRTKARTPFVLHANGNYYIKEAFGIHKGVDPATDTEGIWSQFDHIQYMFTEILLVNYAKLASAIFYDDKLISQHGVENNNESSNYGNYSGENGGWQPNILLDFLTGKVRFRLAEIVGKITAESGKIGDFEVEDGKLISSFSRRISMGETSYTSSGSITLNAEKIIIEEFYGSIPLRNNIVTVDSDGFTVENKSEGLLPNQNTYSKIQLKADGIYRNGTKIL